MIIKISENNCNKRLSLSASSIYFCLNCRTRGWDNRREKTELTLHLIYLKSTSFKNPQ